MAHAVSLEPLLPFGGAGSCSRDIVARGGRHSSIVCRHALCLTPHRNVRIQGVTVANFANRSVRRASSGRSRLKKSVRCSYGHGEAKLNLDDPDESERSVQPYGIPDMKIPDHWDVVGLGQAMVDFSGIVEDEFLHRLGLVKGTRKVVNHEERGDCLRALDGCSYKVTAGGSLSNTLVALARLGAGYSREPSLNVAMTGSVGSDALGDFYRLNFQVGDSTVVGSSSEVVSMSRVSSPRAATDERLEFGGPQLTYGGNESSFVNRTKLKRANVHFLSKPIPNGTTGTVIVLTTPDAQRTMLSYQGMSSIVDYDEILEEQIASSRVLVVEGYLWELPETIETIAKACKTAREKGILVALTASDVSCVNRHREKMWDVMSESADMIFCNADEAVALLSGDKSLSPSVAAQLLSKCCPLVSVTDGARGSYIGLKGEVSYIQPAPCVPIDTCGAGDAYAAGVLYGFLRGIPHLKGIGNLAARVAAVVVGQQGTRLKEEDARELASSIPTFARMPVGLIYLTANEEQSVSA